MTKDATHVSFVVVTGIGMSLVSIYIKKRSLDALF